jgi:hypothetical protein
MEINPGNVNDFPLYVITEKVKENDFPVFSGRDNRTAGSSPLVRITV